MNRLEQGLESFSSPYMTKRERELYENFKFFIKTTPFPVTFLKVFHIFKTNEEIYQLITTENLPLKYEKDFPILKRDSLDILEFFQTRLPGPNALEIKQNGCAVLKYGIRFWKSSFMLSIWIIMFYTNRVEPDSLFSSTMKYVLNHARDLNELPLPKIIKNSMRKSLIKFKVIKRVNFELEAFSDFSIDSENEICVNLDFFWVDRFLYYILWNLCKMGYNGCYHHCNTLSVFLQDSFNDLKQIFEIIIPIIKCAYLHFASDYKIPICQRIIVNNN